MIYKVYDRWIHTHGRICPDCGHYDVSAAYAGTNDDPSTTHIELVPDPKNPVYDVLEQCSYCGRATAYGAFGAPFKNLSINPFTQVASYEDSSWASKHPDRQYLMFPHIVVKYDGTIIYNPFDDYGLYHDNGANGLPDCWGNFLQVKTCAFCVPSAYVYAPKGYVERHPFVHLYSCVRGEMVAPITPPSIVCPYHDCYGIPIEE